MACVQVQAVRWRLQLHWQRECLLESATAAGQLTAVEGDGQLWQAELGEGVSAWLHVVTPGLRLDEGRDASHMVGNQHSCALDGNMYGTLRTIP
jgi:hypothetical protein